MAPQGFYAVYKGRVDKPAIYCSWSQVHPRVTEYTGADQEKFTTLEAACTGMLKRGIEDFDLPDKNSAGGKSMSMQKGKYYAVAVGKVTGIFTDWESARKATDGTPDTCHESFRSKEEAEDFIASWKQAFADVSRRAIMQGLENGWKPRDMKFNVGSLLIRDDETNTEQNEDTKAPGTEGKDNIDLPKVERLAIKEEH